MTERDQQFGRTIQLFLVDGKPSGLRKATIHGWTGITLVSNAASLSNLTARDEAKRTGVYILVGPDPDQRKPQKVYIGEGTDISQRIEKSAKEDHDFWETAIAITTSDDDLTKGHVEYLEARLIQMTADAERITLDNTQKPKSEKRKLPEADIANMEQFLLNVQVILPVVGLDMLKPQPKAIRQSSTPVDQRTNDEVTFQLTHKSGISAFAVEEDGEFVVLENSQVMTNTGYKQHTSYGPLKQKLIDEGVLADTGKENVLKFIKPHAFSSASAAAAVILDRNANGRIEWKVKGSKITYHDWQQEQAEKREAARNE